MRNQSENDLNKIEFALEIINKIDYSVLEFTKLNKTNDEMFYDLLAFYIAQIGEQFAPDKLSGQLLENFGFSATEIKHIYGMRNFIDHHYDMSDSEEIEKTIKDDIPALKLRLVEMRDYLLTQVEKLDADSED